LLIDATRGQAEQGHQKQKHGRVDAPLGDEPAGARGEYGRDAEHQGDDTTRRQSVAQERGREQRGGHRVHRDDHRAQHRRCAPFDGEVQRAELHGLHQESGDGDVAKLAARRKAHARDARPGAEDDGGEPEAERQHRHRRHGADGHVADRIAQGVEERHCRRGPERHAGGRHGPHGGDRPGCRSNDYWRSRTIANRDRSRHDDCSSWSIAQVFDRHC